MNCTIRTFIPYPMARTAIPRHEVVFPFPSPVMTSTSPRRGFSGIRSGAFRGSIALPLRFLPPWDGGGTEPIPVEEYSSGFLYGTIEARRQEASVPEGPVNKNRCMVCAKEGLFEGGICDMCKAIIRGEALEGQHQLR